MLIPKISLAGPEDAVDIISLLEKRYRSQVFEDKAYAVFDKHLAVSKMERRLREASRPIKILLARDNNNLPLGLALWYDAFCSWHYKFGATLEEFYVIGGPYMDGVGLDLYRTFISLMQECGYVRAEARPHGVNSPESRFLQKEGEMNVLDEWVIYRDELEDEPHERFGSREEKYKESGIILPGVRHASGSEDDLRQVRVLTKNLAEIQEINARHIRVSDSEAERSLRRYLVRDNASVQCLLAENNARGISGSTRPCGFASLYPAYNSVAGRRLPWIEDIYAQHTKQGTGHALYKKIYSMAYGKDPFIETRLLKNSRLAAGAANFFIRMGMKELKGPRSVMLRLELTPASIKGLNAGPHMLARHKIRTEGLVVQ